MKILAFSDMFWNPMPIKISLDLTLLSPMEILNMDDFAKVKFYYDIVVQHKPDIIVLCGDITGDGFCGRGHSNSLIAFLKLTSDLKIFVRFVRGNHDLDEEINKVNSFFENSIYVRELTQEPEEIAGYSFVGIAFNEISNKTRLKRSYITHNADFIITHAPSNMRLNLFNMNSKYIFTGHYDLKVLNANDKIFVSLDNDNPTMGIYFATLEVNKGLININLIAKYRSAKKFIYFHFNNYDAMSFS